MCRILLNIIAVKPRYPVVLRLFAAGCCLLLTAVISGEEQFSPEKFNAEQIEFFEHSIRPLLAENCYSCHGAEKSESDFRMNSRDAILKGGESGNPGAIAGKPTESLLIQAVKHEGDFSMPPEKQLTQQQIADLTRWVESGLAWPDESSAPVQLTAVERLAVHQTNHWALQPIKRPALPALQSDWLIESPIDLFVAEKLNEKGLSQAVVADRRALIRRATFDLIGLPPTKDQVDAFVSDIAPDAYERLIDRLLSSPQYGERWGRHWLDVARYSDTRGYSLAGVDRNYPFAFTYRDYVIDAFNDDLSFDMFVRQQLAADQLETADDPRTLAALGFITVGRKFLSQQDTIDDQIDVVTRGLMGLTVGCARCHDHKFDAIPTEDYYALFGVFNSCSEPAELPMIASPEVQQQHAGFLKGLEEVKQNREAYLDERLAAYQEHARTKIADYLVRIILPNQEEQLKKLEYVSLPESELSRRLLQHWQGYMQRNASQSPRIFRPWIELLKLTDEGFVEQSQQLIAQWKEQPASDQSVQADVLAALEAQPLQAKSDLARVYAQLLQDQADKLKAALESGTTIDQATEDQKLFAQVILAEDSPLTIKRDEIHSYLNRAERQEDTNRQSAINKYLSTAPAELAHAMVVVDNPNPGDARVLVRGDARRPGEIAPRRFPAVLSGKERRPFQHGSGRLDLANEIVNPDNPLTARVLVNRIWMHHFNQPLVSTPSDFGIRCEQPLHVQLLDFLARELLDHGWSIKHLHRTIMLSHTYQQSSSYHSEHALADPENQLLWRMNPRRLEFEALRDAMLAVANNLDTQLHGKAIEITRPPYSQRRTVYARIDRQDLPNLFRVFDFASPDQSAAQRTRTIVPQQSLFMMNSAFALEQVRAIVKNMQASGAESNDQKITRLYQFIFARDPIAAELEMGQEFMEHALPTDAAAQLDPWHRYVQLLLFTNEFEYIP
jgi:hypothetical protein